MPEPDTHVSASTELLRKRGVEAYSVQFNHSHPAAGVKLDLPVYPTFLEWFGDTGRTFFNINPEKVA